MVRKTLLIFNIFILFLFFVPVTNANLYINEFSSYTTEEYPSDDWVEIFNSGSEDVDMKNYCLGDEAATKKDLDDLPILTPGGFAVISWENRLNQLSDSIILFKKNQLELLCNDSAVVLAEVEKVSYGKTGRDTVPPGAGKTAGRITDGGKEWVVFDKSTSGATNDAPILPTSTPSPTSVPTPTRTPTPTKTPTPTPTSVPTDIPTPTKTPKPTRTPTPPRTPTPKKSPTPAKKSPTPTMKKSLTPTPKITAKPTAVLGISTRSATLTPKPKIKKPTPTVLVQGSTVMNPQFLIATFSGFGLLTACAILFFLKFKKSRQKI